MSLRNGLNIQQNGFLFIPLRVSGDTRKNKLVRIVSTASVYPSHCLIVQILIWRNKILESIPLPQFCAAQVNNWHKSVLHSIQIAHDLGLHSLNYMNIFPLQILYAVKAYLFLYVYLYSLLQPQAKGESPYLIMSKYNERITSTSLLVNTMKASLSLLFWQIILYSFDCNALVAATRNNLIRINVHPNTPNKYKTS